MPKVFYTQPDGTVVAVEGSVGDSVMATAVRNGVAGVVGQCGGSLSCATCHVYLDERHADEFGEIGEDEDEMLDCTASDREDSSRLSCQLLVGEGEVHVTVPPEQL
jgi:2Fe-2S ferredoxin